MLSICVHYWSAYARQQYYNLSPRGDIAGRKMVWHCYANISLITLQASTTFSPETNSKANILKTTLFFFITNSVFVYFEISNWHTQFWKVLAFNSGLLLWTSFFLPVVHSFVNPLLTRKIYVIFPAMKNAHESQNGLQWYCLVSFNISKERLPYSL